MKKTVIVNINGIIFHIDEDAYGKLSAYLEALHRYFDRQAEGKEIVADIEARIAELLQPLIDDAKQSITIEDIGQIIATLGQPEDIAGEENESEPSQAEKKPQPSPRRIKRKLYRDTDNSVIGGVCSGIAAYFDTDPVIIRIVLIALCFAGGASFIIYPILWIAIPAAITASQKLEMRGEDITVNTIERTHHGAESANQNTVWYRIRSFINEIFHMCGRILLFFWKVVVFLLGVSLILMAIALIISALSAVFFNKFFLVEVTGSQSLSITEFLNTMISPGMTMLVLVLAIFVVFIPLIGIIYGGLKLIIRFQVNDKWAVLSALMLWIAAVITATILVFSQVNNFRAKGEVKELVNLTVTPNNIIYISANVSGNEELDKIHYPPQHLFGIRGKGNKNELWGRVSLNIEKSSKSIPEMEIIREGRGVSQLDAEAAAKQIHSGYTLKDSTLVIDPTFTILQDKWKFQHTRIILRLPVGAKVYLNASLRNLINWTENTDGYWGGDMVEKTWVMTENGLELMRNSKTETEELHVQPGHILHIQKRDRFSINEDQLYSENFGNTRIDDKSFKFKAIHLYLKKSEDKTTKLQIEKRVSWVNNDRKAQFDKDFSYSYELKDTILWLDPVFLLPNDMKQSDQEVNVTLYLPIDSKVSFSADIKPLIRNYASSCHIDEDDLVENKWRLTLDGLRKIEEKKEGDD
jgi:Putative stress-responsive transcriptional regulator